MKKEILLITLQLNLLGYTYDSKLGPHFEKKIVGCEFHKQFLACHMHIVMKNRKSFISMKETKSQLQFF